MKIVSSRLEIIDLISTFISSRSNFNRLKKCLSIVVISSFILPSTAFAYVDPGSGSVIVTTILGLIAAIGYTFRKYFYKIKRHITRSKQQDETSSKTQDNSSEG